MPIDAIVAQIDAEIALLRQVRELLSGDGPGKRAQGIPAKRTSATAKPAKRRKRHLSPEARARIAEAQRKRWAAQKAKSK